MGFEQLAALRQQLTEQAERERRERQKSSPASDNQAAPDARNGKPGGPSARSGKPGKPSTQAGKPAAQGGRAAASGGRPQGESGRPDARRPRSGKPADAGARPARASTPAQDVDPVVVTISRLQRKFPKAFPKKPAAKVPLKLGVHEELIGQADALGLAPEDITLAIKTWCQGARYWACLVENAARVSLEGEAVGVVTAVEAKRARQLAHRQRTGGAVKRKKAKPEQGDTNAKDQAGAAAGDQAPEGDQPAQGNAAAAGDQPVQGDATAAGETASGSPDAAKDQVTPSVAESAAPKADGNERA